MMTGAMCFSLLQFPRCRIQPLPHFRSTYVGYLSHNFHILIHSPMVCSKVKLLGSHAFEPLQQGTINRTQVLRPKSTVSGLRTRDIEKSKPSNVSHEYLDRQMQASTINSAVSSCFRSIQYCDAKRQILESQDPKQLVTVFVFDIETTGFCKKSGRIIEIAIRDLSGGKNSCLHTLINPDQHVPNSHIHGITTNMVNRSDVPRMKDFIPILMHYIRLRQRIPGSLCLFIAHNARSFDVPFLVKEFSRCSMVIPSNLLFLDTLPLARQLMKLNGSRLHSLQALREHYNIQSGDATHRAMLDVDLLSAILEKMTVDMKLTIADFLENSFAAPDPIDLMKTKKKC
ncbi:exonuclease DPD1, chloroplastic/mitochondrial-like [Durio zibethinus]|uniref:Exonuclease DPD1, chloroplastic/mitochondrial-like n=1 Tax=Durio zibethinus TaxID=66656 RepID=A0A6P6A8W1_DURZI|nr:exonuclease DPD1, chloroplastic/mitochondrial-like [Durio zibethinus]